MNKVLHLDEYKEFFENIISFNNVIEVRIMYIPNGGMFSKYAKTFEELKRIVNYYNQTIYNVYCGINPRINNGRKAIDCVGRKNIVFDIERIGNKPPLNEDNYYEELIETKYFISNLLYEKYKLKINAAVISGRGMHLYFSFKNVIPNSFHQFYKIWYKKLVKEINETNPLKNKIKADPPVSDLARVLGLPGSINYKYKELPERKIVILNNNLNDFDETIFDEAKKSFVKSISNNSNKKVTDKYDEKTIFSCPEFRMIAEHNDLPTGEINNKIIFALAMIIRDNKLQNVFEIENALANLGYENKQLSSIGKEYEYSHKILNSWCLNNFKYCLKNKIKLPYKFEVFNDKIVKNNKKIFILNPEKPITSFSSLIDYVKKFNKIGLIYKKIPGRLDKEIITSCEHFGNALYENIKKFCDKELFEYVELNKLFPKIKLLEDKLC